MSFEDASKKYARLILLVFGSFITAGLYFLPLYFGAESTQTAHLESSRSEWMLIYTMIVVFYFKDKEE